MNFEEAIEKIGQEHDCDVGWYDKGHLKEVVEWLTDQTLDISNYETTVEEADINVHTACTMVVKKIMLLCECMHREIAEEVVKILEEIKAENEDWDSDIRPSDGENILFDDGKRI